MGESRRKALAARRVAGEYRPQQVVDTLGTRFAALGLLVMTAVIQLLVYPAAYPTHGVWAAVLLWLMVRGPGTLSLDHALARWRASANSGCIQRRR